MSWYTDEEDRRREERREEQRRFESEVWYQVWRAGGDPDRIDPDRLSDAFYEHASPDDVASRVLHRQAAERQQRRSEEEEAYEQQRDCNGNDGCEPSST